MNITERAVKHSLISNVFAKMEGAIHGVLWYIYRGGILFCIIPIFVFLPEWNK